ncbi:MAG TPA: hypothetical protein VE944_16545 [Nostoc sp.]|uniref:hypothetical protein n=1 Tax=Nostoc sp. TaxID=1180 RepID=UPI002D522861|nr:hypothetical protein [Nostoc sp.]HYX15941.1 hypothetical protein [Nostoc sp.]
MKILVLLHLRLILIKDRDGLLLRGQICGWNVCRNSRVAGTSGQNPGFEFLKEYSDLPALMIAVKKLLAKYPKVPKL